MSGGSLDYAFYKIKDIAEAVRDRADGDSVSLAFASHLEAVAKVAKELEWAWSGDTAIKDAHAAIVQLIGPSAVLDSAVAAAKEVRRELDNAIKMAEAR